MSRKFPTVSNFDSVTKRSEHTSLRAVALHRKRTEKWFCEGSRFERSNLSNAQEKPVTDKNFSLPLSMALYLSDDPDSVRHYLSGNPDHVRHYVSDIPGSARYYASGNPDGTSKTIHCARAVIPLRSPSGEVHVDWVGWGS